MPKDKQLLLPIDGLKRDIQSPQMLTDDSRSSTITLNVSSFLRHKAERDSKDAAAKIREYLDCYKIFR